MHLSRRDALLAAAALSGSGLLAACTPAGSAPSQEGADPSGSAGSAPNPGSSADPSGADHRLVLREGAPTTALATDASTVQACQALLGSATAVVVSDAASTEAAIPIASALKIPLLVDGDGLAAELDRLGTRTVITVGQPSIEAGDRELIATEPGETPEVPGLPAPAQQAPALVLLAPGTSLPAALQPLVAAAAGRAEKLTRADPRVADWKRVRAAAEAPVLGIGDLGTHFVDRIAMLRVAEEIPGGGFLPFPGRHMVALYGHPQTDGLGMLGEQSASASVTRAKKLAAQYQRLLDTEVVPAFELIATVAAGAAGKDGNYSNVTDPDLLAPWVELARKEGVYCVLDLQPGRAALLDQAKIYTDLLAQPHVGLAIDPEWKLARDEKPLQKIGHVDIDEVNEVGRWLADLTRRRKLPPKVLTLHQFQTQMIRDRDELDTSLDEIQWLVHADGQGSQGAKQGTWRVLREDLPKHVWLGWKNFEDEDTPMLTPAQTVARVDPTPYFISYQ